MRSKFIELKGEDGGIILLRGDKISVVNVPSRMIMIKPGDEPPNAVVIIDAHTLHFPISVGEHLIDLLNRADMEDQQNKADLTGQGPSRN